MTNHHLVSQPGSLSATSNLSLNTTRDGVVGAAWWAMTPFSFLFSTRHCWGAAGRVSRAAVSQKSQGILGKDSWISLQQEGVGMQRCLSSAQVPAHPHLCNHSLLQVFKNSSANSNVCLSLLLETPMVPTTAIPSGINLAITLIVQSQASKI